MVNREALLKKEVDRYIELLKEKYKPDLILLFGSLCSGNVREWSDIDLLIVKDTDKPFYDRLKEVYLLLRPKVGVDILVYTPQEYEKIKERLFFKHKVIKKGKLIYARERSVA
jgi:predicted nucleotidyltransferase